MNEFTHCPQCGSTNIEDTDYEEENAEGEYEVDDGGRVCVNCGWEGDETHLVSKN
jgi:hypothetical protein